MKQTVKFKVELEIEIEYDGIPEGCASTPYTSMGGYTEENGHLTLFTSCGNIVKCDKIKLERKPE